MIVFNFISCGIEYDGETKLVVKGKILLENNQPLVNHEVKLYVSREGGGAAFIYYSGGETNFIGVTNTNSEGEYLMVIPKPKLNYDEIIVEINDGEFNPYNKRQIRNIVSEDFIDFELNLENSFLYTASDLSRLFVTINQVTPNSELLSISYEGDFTNEISFFKPLDYYDFFNYELYPLVKKNQTLIIKWEVINRTTNTVLNFEESLLIDGSDITEYTLTF